MSSRRLVRVGTRGSALALAQTALTIAALMAADPDTEYAPTIIHTEGDRDKTTPLTVIGGQGVFTVALQDAMLRGEVDMGVHSAKDVPPATPDGLVLAAFLHRADPRDVFISRHDVGLAALPPGARVGTSSRRRAVQARAINPQIKIVELRGNLDTRLRKSTEPEYDGIIVAAAGLDRMGWQERITEYLPVDRFVPAPGQGAIGIECRADDAVLRAILARVDDDATRAAVTAERAVLAAAGVGCTMPVAAYAEQRDAALQLWGMAADADYANPRWIAQTAPAADAGRAGWQLAEALGLVSGVRA
jgi:hydroxymethylbilane synthase